MDNLDSSCFAYASMRKYPIHTKEDALNSWQSFCAERTAIPKYAQEQIQQAFQKAASYHDIKLQEPAKQEKRANQDQLLYFETWNETPFIMSEIHNEQDLHRASSYILEKRASVHRKNLQEAAKYVIWSAANSDLDMNTTELVKIAQIAGIGVGNREDIEHEFDKRATLNIFTGKNKEMFWNYSKTLKELSDEDFYKEANLNTVCNVLEDIDIMYNNKQAYGRTLACPESVCFASNMDDLLKEASDLAYIKSIDTTISKKALLERADKANDFLATYFKQEKPLQGDSLVEKVASLDEFAAEKLLEELE